LAGQADLRQNQMPRITADFVVVQFHIEFDKIGQLPNKSSAAPVAGAISCDFAFPAHQFQALPALIRQFAA